MKLSHDRFKKKERNKRNWNNYLNEWLATRLRSGSGALSFVFARCQITRSGLGSEAKQTGPRYTYTANPFRVAWIQSAGNLHGSRASEFNLPDTSRVNHGVFYFSMGQVRATTPWLSVLEFPRETLLFSTLVLFIQWKGSPRCVSIDFIETCINPW